MPLNWNGDEFGGSERLSAPQMDEAYRRFDRNMRQLQEFVGNRTTPSGQSGDQAIQRIINESSARAPGGTANDAFRYGISQSLLEKASEMRNDPNEFVRYLDTVRERQNPFAFWDQTPLDPLFERSKQVTKHYVEQATGGQSEWKPFGVYKGENGAPAFAGGALDALIDEAANTAQDIVRITYNPIEASRQFGELLRKVDQIPDLVKQQYQEAEKLIKASTMDDYHKGYLTAKTVLIALDIKDMVETAGKLKHLNNELKAGRVHNIKDALDAFDQGAPKRRRGDSEIDNPDFVQRRPGRNGSQPSPDGTNAPDVPRTKLPNIEQAHLVTQAFGIKEPLASNLTREISAWAGRTGGRIEDIYNSPALLYGSGSRSNSGLLGEAVMDAARIPYDQRKAGHIVLADMRERAPGATGPDLARAYESLMPNGPHHQRFRDAVASVDNVLDQAAAARWRNSPEGRKSLPTHQQADLLAEAFGAEGVFRTQLRREVTAWAKDKPETAIENLRNSSNLLLGDTTGPRPTGLAGEAVVDIVSKNPLHRRAVQEVLLEVRKELVPPGTSRSSRDVMNVYEDIANGNTENARRFDKRVDVRHQELLVGTPEGRKTLPTFRQGDLLAEAYGIAPGEFKDQIRKEIHAWARNKPENAVENLRDSTKTLFGDRTGARPHGIIGEALLDVVSPDSKGPIHRRAAELALGDARDSLFNGKNTYEQVASAYEAIAKPNTKWAKYFDDQLATHRTNLLENTPEGRQSLAKAEQIDLLMKYRGVDGPLAPHVKRELGEWAAAGTDNKIENLRHSTGVLFGSGSGPKPAGLMGDALADAVSSPANRKAVESVVGDLRREAGQQGWKSSQLLERYEQIATPGSTARADFDHRVGKRQVEMAQQQPAAQIPSTPDRPNNIAPRQSETPSTPSKPQPISSDSPTPAGQRNKNPSQEATGGDLPPSGGGKSPPTGGSGGRSNDPERPEDANGKTPTPPIPNLGFIRPSPLTHNGKPWDIVGVNDGAPPSLTVITENAVPRYLPKDALVPPLMHDDKKTKPREVSVVQLDAQRNVASSDRYDIIGVEKTGLKVARTGQNGERIERIIDFKDPNQEVRFDFPGGGRYAARQTVMGSVRFDPLDVETKTIPIVPGMRFEARMQGHEMQGPRLIEMNPKGELFSRNPSNALETPRAIEVKDIAPTWRKVSSTTAPEVDLYIDSAKHREAGLRSGRDGVQPQQINTLSGNTKISHGFANQIYKPVLEALRNPATTGDVSIAMYGFGTSLDGKRYTDALLSYADKHPNNKITIHSGDVEINGKRGPELTQWLAAKHPNITITEPPAPSNFRVPHEKVVAIGDQVFISSEKIGMTMSRKIGFMAEMSGEDATVMHKYIQQLGDPKAPSADRAQMVDALMKSGILIDDPIAGRFPNAAAMYRTVVEAKESLKIFQSDVTDVVAAKLIAEKADQGVRIDLKYRNIDPDSKAILDAAAKRNPNLKHDLVAANGPLSPIYQHENFVLSEKGGVLSSAYMWEPKAGQVPRYTSGGEGGVMLDANQARQYGEFVDRQPKRQIGPGAIINEFEELFKKDDLWPKLLEVIQKKLPGAGNRASAADGAQDLASVASPAVGERATTIASTTTGAPQVVPLAVQPATQPGVSPVADATSMPRPPQPGEPNYLAYAQSGDAVARLNAKLNLDPSQQPQLQEPTEKLRVAAATLAVNEGRRVDAIDLNKPAPNLPAGSLAFVIEQNRNGDTERFGTIKIQEVMQTTLGEGYQKLASATLNQELQTQQKTNETEITRRSVGAQPLA
jgi:hypothetical protein